MYKRLIRRAVFSNHEDDYAILMESFQYGKSVYITEIFCDNFLTNRIHNDIADALDSFKSYCESKNKIEITTTNPTVYHPCLMIKYRYRGDMVEVRVDSGIDALIQAGKLMESNDDKICKIYYLIPGMVIGEDSEWSIHCDPWLDIGTRSINKS